MIHEKLYQSNNLQKIDFESYLSNIMVNLFQTYAVDQDKIKYEIKCDDIKLNIETSVPCGLIITELVTNSIKHAFPSTENEKSFCFRNNPGHKISVSMYLKNDYINLIIKDNGIGFPNDLDFNNTESLGLELVNLLVNQLDGIINLERKEGTEFIIKFKELKYGERI